MGRAAQWGSRPPCQAVKAIVKIGTIIHNSFKASIYTYIMLLSDMVYRLCQVAVVAIYVDGQNIG